jgi:hypothetical protein
VAELSKQSSKLQQIQLSIDSILAEHVQIRATLYDILGKLNAKDDSLGSWNDKDTGRHQKRRRDFTEASNEERPKKKTKTMKD